MHLQWQPRSRQMCSGFLILRVDQTVGMVALVSSLRSLLAALDPNLPLTDVKTMSRRVADATLPTRVTATVLALLAGAVLTLSVTGIFGILALAAGERTQELGLRRVLGAQREDLVRIVLHQWGRIMGVGLSAGAILAWGSTRLLEGLLFGLEPHDGRTFFAAFALLSVSALVASLLPALRAARVDPVVAMRHRVD